MSYQPSAAMHEVYSCVIGGVIEAEPRRQMSHKRLFRRARNVCEKRAQGQNARETLQADV